MAAPYKPIPVDKNGSPWQNTPPLSVALQTFSSENATVSSVLNFTDQTTALEVMTGAAGGALKWITAGNTNPSVVTAAGTSNYDVLMPPNSVRKLAIPQETQGVNSIVGQGVQAGLYRKVAWKTFGIGSIMSAEY